MYNMQTAILGRWGDLLDWQIRYDSAVGKVKQKQTKFAAVLASAVITYATHGGGFVGTAWLVGAVLVGLALMVYHMPEIARLQEEAEKIRIRRWALTGDRGKDPKSDRESIRLFDFYTFIAIGAALGTLITTT